MRSALLALVLLAACCQGCATFAAKDQLQITAAGFDGYAAHVEVALGQGSDADPQVTPEALANTPRPVRVLLERVVEALYVGRKSLHQLNYAVNEGPHPDTMDLDPPEFPPP